MRARVWKARVEQRIAGEDGHGFAEDFVAGRLAAAIVVVVERGKIVVDQRIGVDHFERTGGFEDARQFYRFAPDRSRGRFEAEQRTDALASGEEAVAHRPMDRLGRRGLRRGEAVERGVDEALPRGEEFGERAHFSDRNGSGWYVPSLRISISTRVSASSSCLRQESLSCMPRENRSSDRSRGRSPDSSSFTTFSSSSRQDSKLATVWGAVLTFGHLAILLTRCPRDARLLNGHGYAARTCLPVNRNQHADQTPLAHSSG